MSIQEEKQLLVRDLSARLLYNVKVDITYSKEHGSSDRLRICSEGCLILNTDVLGLYIEDEVYLKPYLRPMSSMTEEEKKIYESFIIGIASDETGAWELTDWLNENHFDYRGLIEKNLAKPLEKMNNKSE